MAARKAKAAPAVAQAAPAELPDWLRGTHYESGYELAMDDGDQNVEEVSLDRQEYISLKIHLGELRGFSLMDEQAERLDGHGAYYPKAAA